MYSSLPVLKSQCDEKDARPAPSRLGSPPTIPALSSMRAKAEKNIGRYLDGTVLTVDSISSSTCCLGTNHPFQAVLVAVWLVLLFATPQIAA